MHPTSRRYYPLNLLPYALQPFGSQSPVVKSFRFDDPTLGFMFLRRWLQHLPEVACTLNFYHPTNPPAMIQIRREDVVKPIGFLGGAGIGAVLLGSIGIWALDFSPGLLPRLAFLASFLGTIFGMVAPLALVRYHGGRGNSRAVKQLSMGGGYVAGVMVIVGVALAAFLFVPPWLPDNPPIALVAFDIVAGVVYGGILGHQFVCKRL